MATAADLRRAALALEGTTESPHFDRAAFKAVRIYVTLAPDGKTANFKFTPEEQEFKCLLAPQAFQPIPNAWGAGLDHGHLVEARQGGVAGRAEDRLRARRRQESAPLVRQARDRPPPRCGAGQSFPRNSRTPRA